MSVPLAHLVDGPESAPAVLLAPSLGTTWEMWDSLAAALAPSYRVVRFDTRGHGRSPVPPGPYTLPDLADDVVALADALDIGRFAIVGLSLGGAVAQTLLVSHPSRLTAAVLACTVPSFGDPASWTERAALVRASGMAVLAEPTRGRWFTDRFRAEHPETVERYIAMITGLDPEGYASCCEALSGFDLWDSLGRITTPVRVVAGAQDQVATPDACKEMVSAIPDADLIILDDAAHIASAEQPTAFDAAVVEHLERHL
jgi:3-oxoadipate enol-lactonase